MLELSRTVRFCLAQDGSLAVDAPADNTFAAWPPMRGLGSYYELEVTCRGEADPVTGYFINIREIDQAVRGHALPRVAAAACASVPAPLGALLRDMMSAIEPALGHPVIAVELRLSPTYRIRIEADRMQHVLISQQYEFSAAHRLHCPSLSDTENRRIFGKCNNPAGHGHNYQLEVSVRCPVDAGGAVPAVEGLDTVVNRAVIEKLDHKHLDHDVPQFAGMNTSVENIAKVAYGMLRPEVVARGMELDSVRLWETGKTVCTYRG